MERPYNISNFHYCIYFVECATGLVLVIDSRDVHILLEHPSVCSTFDSRVVGPLFTTKGLGLSY